MPKWEFRQLKGSYLGGYGFFYLSPEQKAREPQYEQALETAISSEVAKPIFSNYFVREGVVVDGEAIPGGNIEYGFCRSLHGEECMVGAFRSRRGRRVEPFILGIAARNPAHIPNPCGNCRDIMRDDLGQDFEIVCGSREGGMAIVTKMRDFLFEQFQRANISDEFRRHFQRLVFDTFEKGEYLLHDAYSPKNVLPERRYHAAIFGGKMAHYGALDLMCEYHPIYPLRSAIHQARREHDVDLGWVLVVGADTSEELADVPPYVMYMDRQHLMELNLEQELVAGRENDDPRVMLVRCRQGANGREIAGAWETSVKEWLPYPFSPRNFGPEFVQQMTAYCKTRA